MSRVLFVSDSFTGYGAEHILKWLGNNLCIRGYNVTFLSLFEKDRNRELMRMAESFNLGLPDRIYNRNYFTTGIKFICQQCKIKNYDVVITFHTNPFLLALFARPFCGYKLLHSERDNPYARDTVLSKLKMWLYRFSDVLVFQTEGARDFFNEDVKKKSVIIPNPILIPELRWRGCYSKTLVNVGRLDIRYKRQDLLIKAFWMICKDNPEYKLCFYGDGIDKGRLKKLVIEYGLDDKVEFYGKVDNVQERLVDEGIFVMTSDSEGMPNALMEAMALGMPVISTDCEPGGAKALIDSEVNGLLVERASVEGLSTALMRLIEDKSMQTRLGDNARKKMKQFAPDLIFNQWLECFK